ncbi:hypothetical protein RchiOBHm_Chr2g0137521 [Rosa chinensis]|uniref:Uncharacterized protein n=1 Tax=Rosa chinensis TaxID=74649 RepID=A0A2P6RWN5_ROSCH|nr:hypothetical protein RchiOBHm_Chr2g0137521 [Rosa chinensis]
MERKWRDKEDGMDEGIGVWENGEEMVRQGDEMDEGIGFESERRSVFIAQKMMNGGWR